MLQSAGVTPYIQQLVVFLLNVTTPILIDYHELLVDSLGPYNAKIFQLLVHTHKCRFVFYNTV